MKRKVLGGNLQRRVRARREDSEEIEDISDSEGPSVHGNNEEGSSDESEAGTNEEDSEDGSVCSVNSIYIHSLTLNVVGPRIGLSIRLRLRIRGRRHSGIDIFRSTRQSTSNTRGQGTQKEG